jgi:hypothetical protein
MKKHLYIFTNKPKEWQQNKNHLKSIQSDPYFGSRRLLVLEQLPACVVFVTLIIHY